MNNFNFEMNRLRGLGILLVILGHAIFIDMLNTTNVSSAGFYSYLFTFIYSFHMPLFFFISGFFALKALEIKKVSHYLNFIKKKFLQLIVPFFILSITATLIKLALSSFSVRTVDLSSIFSTILLYPWDNPMKLLWYVYTLFFIFAIVPLLNKIPLKIKLIALLVLNILPLNYGRIFNFNGIIRYMFYFYLGIWFVKNYQKFLLFNKKHLVAIVGFVILIAMNVFYVEDGILFQTFELATALIGILFCMCLIHVIKNGYVNSTLNFLGNYSYDIYLLHWFTQMPIRVLYQQFNFNYNILVILSFFAAFLVIPVSKYIVRKLPILNGFLLGNFKKQPHEQMQRNIYTQ